MTFQSFALRLVLAGAFVLVASGCEKSPEDAAAAESAGTQLPALQLAPEDVLTLQSRTLAAGPTITGSILPEKRADLRAEVSAVVLAVLKENGDAVKTGDVLVRLDDTSIRDTLASARTSADSASQAFDQAQRQYERMVKLKADGLVSTQQVEDAEVRRNSAQSERESGKSQLVAASQQQGRTLVRAPFDGIISDRQVSAGDTAQVGKELLKVIDPRSLRFEGYVSANSIGALRQGQKVNFRVNGIEGKLFNGTITRVNPAADASTRQVGVLVSFAKGEQPPGVAGLYAEGQVESSQNEGLALPGSVIVRDGDNAFAWALKDGKLHKVPLKLGDRDSRSGDTVLLEGLAAGDKVLRYPGTNLHDGQPATLK